MSLFDYPTGGELGSESDILLLRYLWRALRVAG